MMNMTFKALHGLVLASLPVHGSKPAQSTSHLSPVMQCEPAPHPHHSP